MSEERAQLQFVSEAGTVNCYYCPTGSRDNAILVGSMRHSLVQSVPGLFRQWSNLIQTSLYLATGEAIEITLDGCIVVDVGKPL